MVPTEEEHSHVNSQLIRDLGTKLQILDSAVMTQTQRQIVKTVRETAAIAVPGDGLAILAIVLKVWMNSPVWWREAAFIMFTPGRKPEETIIDVRMASPQSSYLDAPISCPVPIREFSEALNALNECFTDTMFVADIVSSQERVHQITLGRRAIPGRIPPYVDLGTATRREAFKNLADYARQPGRFAAQRASLAPPTDPAPAPTGTSGYQTAIDANSTLPCVMRFSEPPPAPEIPRNGRVPSFPLESPTAANGKR